MPPEPFLADVDLTLYQGDVLAVLGELPDESVDCVVTSPPYWGLRDYGTADWEGGDSDCDHLEKVGGTGRSTLGAGSGGNDMSDAARERSTTRSFVPYREVCGKCGAARVDNQLGLEASPKEYVEKMVEVFREVRRVLRKHGTCWLNIGDSYARPPAKGMGGPSAKQDSNAGTRRHTVTGLAPGMKEKDLCMIPALLALALRDDGWHLRSEIIWSKPNPMPESVTDRPTRSEERIYLLTKSPSYYYDQEAVREAFETRPQRRLTSTADQPGGAGRAAVGGQNPECQGGTDLVPPPPQAETLGDLPPEAPRGADGRRKTTRVEYHENRKAHENYANAYGGERWPSGGRNMRSVWTIATQPYPGAHFAVFPEEVVRRCVLAGTSEKGYCSKCGAPWEREIERGESTWAERKAGGATRGNVASEGLVGAGTQRGVHGEGASHTVTPQPSTLLGWLPSCECGADPRPAVVLDPFAGSGTTAYVARKLGRHALLIELSADYCELIAARTQQLSLLGEDAA